LTSPNLDDIGELNPLASKGGDKLALGGQQRLALPQHRQPDCGWIDVVGGLGKVYVVVGMDCLIVAGRPAKFQQRKIGYDLVHVHVGRRTGAALHHVDGEMWSQHLAADQPVAGPVDGIADIGVDQSQFEVGGDCGLLDHCQSDNELGEVMQANTGDVEVFRRPHRMNSKERILRNADIAEQIGFQPRIHPGPLISLCKAT
jgi:hypothetical protein